MFSLAAGLGFVPVAPICLTCYRDDPRCSSCKWNGNALPDGAYYPARGTPLSSVAEADEDEEDAGSNAESDATEFHLPSMGVTSKAAARAPPDTKGGEAVPVLTRSDLVLIRAAGIRFETPTNNTHWSLAIQGGLLAPGSQSQSSRPRVLAGDLVPRR